MASPTLRIIEAAQQPVQRWKNGGGSTTQIISYPPNASLDDFDWRVSMARMETDGPFSLFPGIDRTLAILQGEGVTLEIADLGEIKITQLTPPASFPGDHATQARLLGGPITDLNVMSRRGRYRHRLRFMRIDGAASLTADADVLVLLCLGEAQVGLGDEFCGLKSGDAALLSDVKGRTISLRAAPPAALWMVDIEPVSDA